MRKNVFLYFLIVLGCGIGIYFTLQAGKRLETSRTSLPVAAIQASTPDTPPASKPNSSAGTERTLQTLLDNLHEPLSLLNDWESVSVCACLIFVATLGKLGGSMFIARWTGMGWHDSFALGTLMNTRGLVELIVLNIGFDLGILSPRVFTMMVIMALVTTFMTSPLLSLGNLLHRRSLAMATPSTAG